MKARVFSTLIAGAALAAASACGKPSMETAETTAPVPVTVEASKIDTLTGIVSATGVVTPAPGGDWTIIAPGPSRIVEIAKAENDPVKTGDVLVRFEMPSLTAELNAKKAEVAQATAKVDTAQRALNRQTGLLAQGVASQATVEAAKQDLADAQATLESAKSAVAANQLLSDQLVVHAKFDGIVAKRFHNPGEMVDASSSDPVLRVINPRQLQILAAVPMSALGRIINGRSAKVTEPGGGDPVDATVLTKPAQVDPANATADVRLAFAKPTDLPVGAVVQVDITAEVHPNVVVVRSAAIISEEDEIFVLVAGTDNRAKKYPVVLGFATHDMTEIKNGLTPGLPVIIRGQDGLADGAQIVVQK